MPNSFIKIKRSTVHNPIVKNSNSDSELNEGLVIPEPVMKLAGIKPFE